MSNYQSPVPEGKDPVLWEIAQKRASFKQHLLTYIIVNAFLWILWFFTSQNHSYNYANHGNNFPWPVWPTLGWGIGIALHYAGAYVFPKTNNVEREYDKLKNKNL